LSKIKKILVIRFSSIGDIVLTSPVVRCLKQQLNAEVHFLTKSIYAPIVKPNSNIDKVFEIKKGLNEVLRHLESERYDYIIDLHKNIRSFQVRMALKTRNSTFNKLNYEKWLLTNFKVNKLPDVHIVDRYLKAVEFLGVHNDGKGLDYFIPEKEEVDVTSILKKETSYIAFAIGAAHATKRLPIEKIMELCKGIEMPIVLLGGKEEQAIGNSIVQKLGDKVMNYCGQLTISQSASLVQQSKLVITHDTGMMHIAAAFKKPIISIWGNTVPAFGMSPYYPNEVEENQSFEVADLSCRPCSKIGYKQCPKGHFKCMNSQNTTAILQAIKRKLNLI